MFDVFDGTVDVGLCREVYGVRGRKPWRWFSDVDALGDIVLCNKYYYLGYVPVSYRVVEVDP